MFLFHVFLFIVLEFRASRAIRMKFSPHPDATLAASGWRARGIRMPF